MGKTLSYLDNQLNKKQSKHHHKTREHIADKAGPERHLVSISAILVSVGSQAIRIVPAATASRTR
jgi:hypothetical protein